MLRLSVQALKLQLTSAAVMSLRVAMERVFLYLNAVIGLNITVLTALTSSTAVCYTIFSSNDQNLAQCTSPNVLKLVINK